jgi:hypothetical protein
MKRQPNRLGLLQDPSCGERERERERLAANVPGITPQAPEERQSKEKERQAKKIIPYTIKSSRLGKATNEE